MKDFTGKTALVTGAARGIGRAIAEDLAGRGADLALCDLEAAWLTDTAKAVQSTGSRVITLSVDVGDSSQVDAAVKQVLDHFDGIDILVNNAGITCDSLLVRMRDEDWDRVLRVNLRGSFLFTRAVAKPMMKRRGGAIVNIASIIGLIGNAGQCNYAASKAGVIALTKSAARELAGRGVRVNAVAPGFIASKMTDDLPEQVKNKMLENIPAQRFGKPEDVAATVAFLAGESAAYVTGQVLNVSGGMVM